MRRHPSFASGVLLLVVALFAPTVPAFAASSVHTTGHTAAPGNAAANHRATRPNHARRRVVLSPAARQKWRHHSETAHGSRAPRRSGKTSVTVRSAARARDFASQRTAVTAGTARAAASATAFAPPFGQCPAVGYDTGCGILVNVTDGQVQILADSGQGPYDGSDDTLIGVVNSSTATIHALSLSSGTDIFGFDQDGICSGFTPAPAGCPFGPTGYEGPGTSFSGINADGTGGTVDFAGGLAPGATAYFSLEEALDPTTTFGSGPSTAEQGGAPNPSEHLTTCYAKLPVNCATGTFLHTFTDAVVPGRGAALSLQRGYDSGRAATDGPFGRGWTDSYAMSLGIDPSTGTATITQENGSQVSFLAANGAFTAPPRVLASLVQNADGSYSFTRRNDHIAYAFDASGRLTSETDPDGHTTTLHYTGSDLTDVTDPAGRTLTFTYAGGHVATVTDPLGRTDSYGYDAAGDLTSATDPAGHTWTFGYTADHLLQTMTDARGGTVSNVYDASGRVTAQTDPAGLRTTWSYSGDPASPAGGETTMTDAHGNVTVYDYVGLELLSVTHAAGTAAAATTGYTYDAATLGQATVTDPGGQVTTSTFDADGNLLSRTDPLGETTSYAYDALDDLIQATSPLGESTFYSRDGAGRLLSVTDPAGGTTTYTYDSADPGDITAVTDPDGRTTRLAYDSYGDTVSRTTSPDAASSDTETAVFDADGEAVCRTTAKATAAGVACPAAGATRADGTTSTVYDADGQVTSVTDPAGHTTSYAYDAGGNRTSVTDPAGHVTTSAYDADDRAVRSASGTGSASTSAYDLAPGAGPCAATVTAAATYCTTSTDPAGGVTVDYYDARDQLIAQTTPGGHTTTRGYDITGSLTSLTDAAGRTTTFGYDAAGRRQSVAYSDGSTAGATYSYDLDGRRTAMQDGTGTTTYSYDPDGRLTGTADGSGADVGYAHDGAGNVVTLTYPGGHQVTRGYDGAGRLTSVTDWLGHTTTFGYDPDGNQTRTGYPVGDTLSNTYDPAGVLTGSQLTGSGGGTLAALAYTRGADERTAGETDSGALQGGAAYTYDAGGRLTGTGSTPYAYDAAGRATTFGGAHMAYDAAGELTSAVTGTGTTTYGYDAVGERTRAATAASALSYTYDQAGNLTGAARTDVAPVVTSVSPAAGPTRGGTAITLTGTGFTAATAVHVGSASAAFTVKSDTTITATTPAGTGAQSVTVTTPGGTSPVTSATRFSYVSAPTVTRVSPPAGPLAGGGKVTVTGAGLTGVTAVRFGARAAHFTVGTSTSLTAVAPAASAGPVDITVTTAGGTSARTTADRYLYTNAPYVTGVSPYAGPLGGGTQVTISGVNMSRPTAVRFGAKTARFVSLSATAVRATAPSGTGTVDIQVSTRLGTSVKVTADHYAYRPRPTVTRISPSVGSTRGGTTVTITGTWLTGASSVHFGTRAARITRVTPTAVTAVSPAGTAVVDVTVTTPGGTSARTTRDRYTYRATTAVTRAATDTTRPLAAYSYNADGLRVARSVNGTVSHLTWDTGAGTPLLLGDGTDSYLYGPGGLPVERISAAGTATYFVHDATGSTRVLLASDGSVAATFAYDAYGALTRSTGTATTPLLYAAGYRDAETGLYYLIHRAYDPATGQFLSRDPAVDITGQPYSYAGDDPANAVDPLGLFSLNPFTDGKEAWENIGKVAAVIGGTAVVVGGLAALCVVTLCAGDAALLAGAAATFEAMSLVNTVATGVQAGSEINAGCLYGEGFGDCVKALGGAAVDVTLAKYGDQAFEALGLNSKVLVEKFDFDQAADWLGKGVKWTIGKATDAFGGKKEALAC